MNKTLVILLIVANELVSSAEARAKMKKYIWLDELQPCANSDPDKAFLNGTFKYVGRGEFQLDIDIFAPQKLYNLFIFVDIKKCPTRRATDDCEHMISFPVQDQCFLENAYFRNLYNQFQPTVLCPIQGHYQARNVVLESEKYSTFFRGLSEEEWLHTYINIYIDEKMVKNKEACLLVIANMRKARVQVKANQNRTQ
ncbi:uncharacterized protein [Halyomorpha halys]|uniref:uncharacterized protein n=1 Tax=Halyomorpha halys TaxID=286706 RepID=UPI0006D51949|nr:uncharacterized protein LOC106683760 [Halyomorpha halys]